MEKPLAGTPPEGLTDSETRAILAHAGAAASATIQQANSPAKTDEGLLGGIRHKLYRAAGFSDSAYGPQMGCQ